MSLLLFTLALSAQTAFADKLSGSGFRYTYDNGNDYEICFKSDTDLTWKSIKGEEAGTTGNEKYSVKTIADKTFLIGWIEKSGFAVSQALNLKKMTINSHLIFSKEAGAKPEMILVSGSVTKLNKQSCQ